MFTVVEYVASASIVMLHPCGGRGSAAMSVGVSGGPPPFKKTGGAEVSNEMFLIAFSNTGPLPRAAIRERIALSRTGSMRQRRSDQPRAMKAFQRASAASSNVGVAGV